MSPSGIQWIDMIFFGIFNGSPDGGLNWHILDEKTSQTFKERFQRKVLEVKSPGILANAFRLRFAAVRDPTATSRVPDR
ncbi:unnamed protein product [Coffea canephora]|uniref:Uncharacterized protein n=1 Tax=Coffea canephora TaxID=49390 RepID=A0A068UJP7_COFCA|nr:unnamed protein product [Coffea canephora]